MPGEVDTGSEIAGYVLEAVLGSGQTGVVYRARDSRLHRPVAVKVIRPELCQATLFRARFTAQAAAVAAMEHPHVVPIYEISGSDERCFVVMRLVEVDLAAVLRTGPLPAPAVADLAAQLGAALDAAHERGLVHGAVKPSNVLMARGAASGGGDHAYLTDFGSAGVGTVVPIPATPAGADPDRSPDVRGLAALISCCLTGSPGPLSAARPDVPASVGQIVSAAQLSGANAFPTCGALAAAFTAAVSQNTHELRRTAERSARTGMVRRTLPALAECAPLRWRALLAALAAVVLVAATAGTVRVTQGRQRPVVTADSVVAIDLQRLQPVAAVPIGAGPHGIAVGPDGTVWVASERDRTLTAVPPGSGRKSQTIGANVSPAAFTVAAAAIWVIDRTGRFGLLNSGNGNVIYHGDLAPGGTAVATDVDGGAWVAHADRGTVTPIDAGTRLAGSPVSVPGASALVAADGVIWVASRAARALWKLDPRTRALLRRIPLPAAPQALAADARGMWVATDRDSVLRLDPATGTVVATVAVGRGPTAIAVDGQSVWTANGRDGTLTRINAAGNSVVGTVRLGHRPSGLAIARGELWVTVDG